MDIFKLRIILKSNFPKFFRIAEKMFSSKIKYFVEIYPRILGNEVKEVKKVLNGWQWNSTYGKNLQHEHLEKNFSSYIGVENGIATGSGGVGIQLALRALNLPSGSEVLIQIDTCYAAAMAVLNSGLVPIFCDSNPKSFLIDIEKLQLKISARTKVIIATHMWGSSEDVIGLATFAKKNNLILIEDACLALGSEINKQKIGSFSDLSIFSFGSSKPLQAGEGGMVLTNNNMLAKEIKSLRNWGERTFDFDDKDVKHISWNGRMPETTAAVVNEQLRNYPKFLEKYKKNISGALELLQNGSNFNIMTGIGTRFESNLIQVNLRITDSNRLNKVKTMKILRDKGLQVFHANFVPLYEYSVFNSGSYLEYIKCSLSKGLDKFDFPGASEIYQNLGIGLNRINFLTEKRAIASVKKILDIG